MLLPVLESLFLIWMALAVFVLLLHGDLMARFWREPVLRRPILIIESDDWGAGPLKQTAALKKLSALLEKFSDRDGRYPVMTLGLVLATADTERMRGEGLSQYQRLTLDDERFDELRQAITDGVSRGVFAPQLHGMEHYWPEALMRAANDDESVRQWLTGDALPDTEALPSPLQSRWVDASVLPAREIDEQTISAAVKQELALYQDIFGCPPQVVVPPTFIWNQMVEASWAQGGIEVVVTPGHRSEGRDHDGKPSAARQQFHNGEQAASGVSYIVRDDYFEPALGHPSDRALQALAQKAACGRPALLETHRFNFTGDEQTIASSLHELEMCLQDTLNHYPAVAFISTRELARVLVKRDRKWVDDAFSVRANMLIERMRQDYRLSKYCWILGLWLFQIPLKRLTQTQSRPSENN